MFKIDQINDTIRIARLDLAAFAAEHGIDKKRNVEKEGTSYLLKKLFGGRAVELNYTENKKPYLEGENTHISISHSHDKLVIIANTKENTGIDVELIREKIKNIRHKFLNDGELLFADQNTEMLTVLWAAKESIYKAYGLKEVDFKKNIIIEEFNQIENNFFGKIDLPNFKKRYLLTRERKEAYILVYILNEV